MIVIIDIDNTLSLSNKRFELAKKENGKLDWDIVHSSKNIIMDEPNLPMIELAKNYKENGTEVIILTGRPESTRKVRTALARFSDSFQFFSLLPLRSA